MATWRQPTLQKNPMQKRNHDYVIKMTSLNEKKEMNYILDNVRVQLLEDEEKKSLMPGNSFISSRMSKIRECDIE